MRAASGAGVGKRVARGIACHARVCSGALTRVAFFFAFFSHAISSERETNRGPATTNVLAIPIICRLLQSSSTQSA